MTLRTETNETSTLFKKTGFMLSAISGLFLLVYLAAKLFPDAVELNARITPTYLLIVGATSLLFTASALYSSLHWLQPIALLILTPLPMLHHASSMFALGVFVGALILLFRIGFFTHNRIPKFLILISYFYLCEVLIGLCLKTGFADVFGAILFTTISLAFLMVVYKDKWVLYLKEPKPTLSLKELRITPMEAEYLTSLLKGKSIKEIAIDGEVKESTVRNTLARVYRKFDVQDKSALMAKCENFTLVE